MYTPDNYYPRLWRDPLHVHCHYLGTIATIVEAVAAAGSIAAAGYQAAQGAPKIPNAASASRGIAQAKAGALPLQMQIAAAEQQGGKVTVPIAKGKAPAQMVRVPVNGRGIGEGTFGMHGGLSDFINLVGGSGTKLVPYVASEWQAGGKYANLLKKGQTAPKILTRNVKVPAHTQDYDFSGYGTADIEGELAKKNADIQLALGDKYGTQFAEEARREADLADPQGAAARAMENDLIQKELKNPRPINSLSTTLESQIDSQLKAGRGLDPMTQDLLDQAVARANADRSGQTSAGDVATSMTTGNEGQARLDAAEAKAQGFLSSGSSPEDIAYRREQQNLADLSSFVSGRTPESQFQNLSGAEQGATPFSPGQAPPTMPGGSAQQGNAYSVAGYQANTRAAANTPSPWLSGLSSLLSSASALGKATA